MLRRRKARDPTKFPTAQLSILALSRLAEPIALTSVYPYSFMLMKGLHAGNEGNASFYAGLFISAFSLAESMTGIAWGSLSDRIGRKPVLILGNLGTILSLLTIGFAPNIWVALLGRLLAGALNGNTGVIQTIVGEMVENPDHRPRAYAVMPFFFTLGTTIGPAIGGASANPSVSYPSLFPSSSIFSTFPYLLPNLICAILVFISSIISYCFLEETHPDVDLWNPQKHILEVAENPNASTAETSLTSDDLGQDSYGTIKSIYHARNETENTVSIDTTHTSLKDINEQEPILTTFTRPVVMLNVALGILACHSISFIQLLPIFLLDDRATYNDETSPYNFLGGLGFDMKSVGLVMSVGGMITLAAQIIVFPLLTNCMGVQKSFLLVTLVHPVVYLAFPCLVFLPDSWVQAGIYICLSLRNILVVTAFPLIMILLQEAAPSPLVLGKINGMAASVGAGCRTLAPPLAGYLYDVGSREGFTALPWWGTGLIAIIGAFHCWSIGKKKGHLNM